MSKGKAIMGKGSRLEGDKLETIRCVMKSYVRKEVPQFDRMEGIPQQNYPAIMR